MDRERVVAQHAQHAGAGALPVGELHDADPVGLGQHGAQQGVPFDVGLGFRVFRFEVVRRLEHDRINLGAMHEFEHLESAAGFLFERGLLVFGDGDQPAVDFAPGDDVVVFHDFAAGFAFAELADRAQAAGVVGVEFDVVGFGGGVHAYADADQAESDRAFLDASHDCLSRG